MKYEDCFYDLHIYSLCKWRDKTVFVWFFMGGSHDKWSSDILSVVYKVRITLGQNYLEVSPLTNR